MRERFAGTEREQQLDRTMAVQWFEGKKCHFAVSHVHELVVLQVSIIMVLKLPLETESIKAGFGDVNTVLHF